MSDLLRTPERRTCERCGRIERYDDALEVWRADHTGETYCIHEWDIDGAFVPIQTEAPTAAEEC